MPKRLSSQVKCFIHKDSFSDPQRVKRYPNNDVMDSALDAILQEYVRQELWTTDGGVETPATTSAYVQELHECLERRGVTRQLQAFLRQRLVAILQEKYPQLMQCPFNFGASEFRLVHDFLSCKKLLFTLSVYEGEIGKSYGKLMSSEAESLLHHFFGLPNNSARSQSLLRKYFEDAELSLLECIFREAPWSPLEIDGQDSQVVPGPATFAVSISQRFKEIEDVFQDHKRQSTVASEKSMDERLFAMRMEMEKDKESKIQAAISNFKEQEEKRIRNEVKQEMEFSYLAKEKELLSNYKEKLDLFEMEKTAWRREKERQMKEIELERRKNFHVIQAESEGNSATRLSQAHQPEPLGSCMQPVREERSRPQRDFLRELDADKVTFLQYNLERQSEEIRALRDQLYAQHVASTAVVDRGKGSDNGNGGIINFLAESRKRCQVIEKAAKDVERRLAELKRSRPGMFSSRPGTGNSSILELLNKSSQKLHPSTSTPIRTRPETQPQQQQPSKAPPPKRITINVSGSAALKPTETEKLLRTVQAVKKGALSFEKVTSDEDNNDNSVSVISENGRQHSSTSHPIIRSVQTHFDEVEPEPVKLPKQDSPEAVSSVSVSAPLKSQTSLHSDNTNKSSNGNNVNVNPNSEKESTEEESDFWKL